jgi:flagellar basal-body rod protein FlgF
MADKGIFTAVSGAMAQNSRLETIANNIANANTTAFKRDSQVFQEYLTSYEKAPDVITVPRIPASIESFYDMQGGDKSYVDAKGTFTDFAQGAIKPTGNPLDTALEGKGFFEILTPQGVQYTRNGSFNIDSQGRIVNKDGYPVLASGAPTSDAQQRIIYAPQSSFSIGEQGEILSQGQEMSRLSIVQFPNGESLRKVGNGRFAKIQDSVQPIAATGVRLHGQALEGSNVNVIQEMTDMISASRVFESTQKAIQAYDQMNGKMIDQVPRL